MAGKCPIGKCPMRRCWATPAWPSCSATKASSKNIAMRSRLKSSDMLGNTMGSMGDVPSSVTSVSRIPLETFAGQCQRKMQPLVDRISYYSEIELDEEQVRQNLREPAVATPRSLLERIPP